MKTCGKCKQTKDLSCFGVCAGRKDGLSPRCRECWAEHYKARREQCLVQGKVRYQVKRGEILAANKARYERVKAELGTTFSETRRERHYRTRYGITLERYNQLLSLQNNRCKICGESPNKKRLAVDHDHQTGEIRGLLCDPCNKGLGHFRDDPELLKRAVAYLI